jgi:amino acid transporter
MNTLPVISLVEILASSIAPVTLITGTAFLTSILTPRFGRCIDRIRVIMSQLNKIHMEAVEYQNLLTQLNILYKRTRVLRNTMTAAGICILFVVFTIISTFSHLFFGSPGTGVTMVTFILALLCLVVLTLGLIYDFAISLSAVELEIKSGLHKKIALDAKSQSMTIQTDRLDLRNFINPNSL